MCSRACAVKHSHGIIAIELRLGSAGAWKVQAGHTERGLVGVIDTLLCAPSGPVFEELALLCCALASHGFVSAWIAPESLQYSGCIEGTAFRQFGHLPKPSSQHDCPHHATCQIAGAW